MQQVMAARQGEASTSDALEASNSGDLGQEADVAAEEGLTDAQLMEVFKQTSIFNVKSALANNENLVHAEADDELQTDLISDSDLSDTDEWEYLRGFWSGSHGSTSLKLSTHTKATSMGCVEKVCHHGTTSVVPNNIAYCHCSYK